MKYDFYIVELCFSATLSNIFVIGVENEDEDIFLVGEESHIMAFCSLENIVNFINNRNTETFPFNKNKLVDYKQLFSNERAYYSFTEIEEVLLRNVKIDNIGKDDAGILIVGYNLISDYFYQTKNEECLLLRKNINMDMFFDYCYYKYFWKQGEEWLELEKKLSSFDYSEFVRIFKELISVFEKSIKIVRV
ncbi:hypothetical protein LZQ00_14565 [Sphingobacterium sp. SRCM116780]|uniref:hypothetical protein n=1 Tax=Sphingobacterium sp. SRCM116780 TaxID=2907623 RepID=UPI001F400A1A|nr:hypothetical protein [Sphingobacterium sp. SRCM116780]UIR55482.1 hypothetical protein LZQ00_14565 [Sphingobacterium sp. SRCM116780]